VQNDVDEVESAMELGEKIWGEEADYAK